jgi:hypothetical protein
MRKRKTLRRQTDSGKGALIKGMSTRLPVEIFESPLFNQRLKELMRGYAGVYALYRRKKLYYVGLSKDLLGRVNTHRKDRHRGKWDSVTIFRIRRIRYIKDIETLLHQLFDTKGNRVQGQVPRDADFNRVLRQVLNQHQRSIRGLARALRKA